ncbi:MAG: alpha/beta fold hydrolase [Gammaproteobacteria bacterium]|nr:alpha/beta fold hydrolase [Gammaproteobacteria bacterium]
MAHTASDGTVYEFSGPAGAPVVALVHGLGLHRGLWRDYLAGLSRGFRVLSYDLVGHGESPAPTGEPTLATFSAQLLALLDELEIERCTIAGFSLGGMINRRFAIDHPQRLQAMVILNSPHERAAEAQRLVEQRALDSAAGGPGATLDATIERWFTPDFIAANPDYIESVRGWVLANDPVSYAKCRKVLAFGVVELIRPEPPLRQPTLIMTCENDSGSTPAMSRAIGSEIDGSRVIIVPRLQHMGLVEQPALFLEPMLDFLGALPA